MGKSQSSQTKVRGLEIRESKKGEEHVLDQTLNFWHVKKTRLKSRSTSPS